MKTFAKIIAIFILLLCIAGCASLLQNNNKASIESVSNNHNSIEEQSSSVVSGESTINSQSSDLSDNSENIKSAMKPISQQELLTQITSALNTSVPSMLPKTVPVKDGFYLSSTTVSEEFYYKVNFYETAKPAQNNSKNAMNGALIATVEGTEYCDEESARQSIFSFHDLDLSDFPYTIDLGYNIKAGRDHGAGHAWTHWNEGRWNIFMDSPNDSTNANSQYPDSEQLAKDIVEYLEQYMLPAPQRIGAINIRNWNNPNTTITWQNNKMVYQVSGTDPMIALKIAVAMELETSKTYQQNSNSNFVVGSTQVLDYLWDVFPESHAEYPADSLMQNIEFPTIAGKLYRFYTEHSKLMADTLDWRTFKQSTAQIVHDFADEVIVKYHFANNILTVYTDTAAYQLNDKFQVQFRKKWPASLNQEDIENVILNDTFNKIAFAKNGVYFCNTDETANPVQIQKAIPFNTQIYGDLEYPFPIQFVSDNRLFIGVNMWEHIGKFSITGLDGTLFKELPFAASGAHSVGRCFVNKAIAIFKPMEIYKPFFFYDFEEKDLKSLDWCHIVNLNYINQFIPDPLDPYIWYASCQFNSSDNSSVPRKVGFFRIDFKNESEVELPVYVKNANAKLLAVNQKGEILFSYYNQKEQGFGIH